MHNFYKKVLIVGAGPSGLSLAYELIKNKSGYFPIIIEKESQIGGLAKTNYLNDFGFDVGGHIILKTEKLNSILDDFFKNDNEIFSAKFSESIFLNGVQYSDFRQFTFLENLKLLISYFKRQFFKLEDKNLETNLINIFGDEFYNIFLKEFLEKFWNLPLKDLDSKTYENYFDRYKFFNLVSKKIKLKIYKQSDKMFYYPKYGYSQIWNKMAQYIINNGGKILLNTELKSFKTVNNKVINAIVKSDKDYEISADYFASSACLNQLVKGLELPFSSKQNALNLKYRNVITVNFCISKLSENLKNSKIFVSDTNSLISSVEVFSLYPASIFKKNNKNIVSLTFLTSSGDKLWSLDDKSIEKLAINEIDKIKLFNKEDILFAQISKFENAYPIYFGSYKNINKVISSLLEYNNLYLLGRNGQHQNLDINSSMQNGIDVAYKIMNLR